MPEQGTYNSLILLERDIDSNMKSSPAFRFFNSKKIKEFYERNGPRLKAARQHLNNMAEEHVAKGPNGELLKEDTSDGSHEFIFLTPADKEEYTAKFEALMKQQIDIYN